MLRTAVSRCPSCSSILAGPTRLLPGRASSSATLSTAARSSVSSLRRSRSVHTTSAAYQKVPSFDGDRPAPPRLPAHLQKEFEELQRKAATPLASSSLSSNKAEVSSPSQSIEEHPDLRRKPKPEFEGEVNPKTGEVGGPKNDPLAYEKEWTYGGRATDF